MLLLSLSACSAKQVVYTPDNSWLFPSGAPEDAPGLLVAHAMGGIDGISYTNSLEAMTLAYKNGLRVMEGDMMLLDGKIIFLHELEEVIGAMGFPDHNISYEDFMSAKRYDAYSSLCLQDVLYFMADHPDLYFMTDIKCATADQIPLMLELLVKEARRIDESLLSRVIVQLYNQEMLDLALKIYPFPSLLYTLYVSRDTNDEVLSFCLKKNLNVVTISEERFTPEFAQALTENGIYFLVHTINDPAAAQYYFSLGASGIYTDFLTPALLAQAQ